MIEFQAWPKTPRLFRDITITEKIDGTNAAIIVDKVRPNVDYVTLADDKNRTFVEVYGANGTSTPDVYEVGAQSRKRLITPTDDNFGLARWVKDNAETLVETLGEGRHYGEWWGSGIQRGYGLAKGEKRFSLFNVHRYLPLIYDRVMEGKPLAGLDTVPVLYEGPFREEQIEHALYMLAAKGSRAAPGFDKPEGVVVFHSASGHVYKVTLDNDGQPKSAVQ